MHAKSGGSSAHYAIPLLQAMRAILRILQELRWTKSYGFSWMNFPESWTNWKRNAPLVGAVIFFSVLSSPKDFLTGLIGPFSDENSLKLENLEKRIIADGFPQMLSELESSSKSFLEELKVLRQELIIR